jgi:uncharacterized protein YjbI with pentapeptide repeats
MKVLRWVVIIAALAALAAVVGVIIYGLLARPLLGRPNPGWIGVANKEVWDWLELLIVPVALAVGVYWLNQAQRKRELEVENQRAQDEALQAYIEQIAQLILDKERPLLDRERSWARAWTLMVLNRLDGIRKGSVVQFLHESGLILTNDPVVSLSGANLSNTDLSRVHQKWADRLEVPTSKTPANPEGTSRLMTASMMFNLRGVNLSGAYLDRARLTDVELAEAIMYNARLPEADFSGADLSKANLSSSNLSEARLHNTNLSGAILTLADLGNADLSGAQLKGHASRPSFGIAFVEEKFESSARVTDDQQMKCKRLTGATMPNGQKYEDWRKDKEGRREDGENSGPS